MRELGIGFAYFTPKKGRNRDAGLQHPTAQLQDPGQRRLFSWPEGRPVGVPELGALQAALEDMGAWQGGARHCSRDMIRESGLKTR